MSEEFFIYNGLLKRTNEPNFKVDNRALLYGDGFFESIIAFNTNIPFLNLHLNRIEKAFQTFKFNKIDIFSNPDEIKNSIVYLARKNKLYKTFRIRITFFRRFGGLYLPTTNDVDYIIQLSPLPYNKFKINTENIAIDTYDEYKIAPSVFSQFKTLNAIPNIQAKIYAKNKKLNDVLFINYDNNITEATSANLFLIIDNQIITPKIEHGCVNGVMRHIIINIAKDKKITIFENNVTVDDLNKATEVFFTNAVKGIQSIMAFRRKRYSNLISKELIQKLNEVHFI